MLGKNKKLFFSFRSIRSFSATFQDGRTFRISSYKTRWLIERYHFVLKSGCKIEKLQLEDSVKMDRALATYSIVAWRLMHLTYLARLKPNSPCTIALEEDE